MGLSWNLYTSTKVPPKWAACTWSQSSYNCDMLYILNNNEMEVHACMPVHPTAIHDDHSKKHALWYVNKRPEQGTKSVFIPSKLPVPRLGSTTTWKWSDDSLQLSNENLIRKIVHVLLWDLVAKDGQWKKLERGESVNSLARTRLNMWGLARFATWHFVGRAHFATQYIMD